MFRRFQGKLLERVDYWNLMHWVQKKNTWYTEFLFSLHERYRKTFCFKKIERDMIKILIHVVIGLGKRKCYFIHVILQQNNRRALQHQRCIVFIIFKQLDTEVITKIHLMSSQKSLLKLFLLSLMRFSFILHFYMLTFQ